MIDNSIKRAKENINSLSDFIDEKVKDLPCIKMVLRESTDIKLNINEQTLFWKNLALIFNNYYPQKDREYDFRDIQRYFVEIVNKEWNQLIFQAFQDNVSTNKFWNEIITNHSLSENLQIILDFSKIPTYSHNIEHLPFFDNTRIDFVNYCIENDNLSVIDYNYSFVDRVVEENKRLELVKKVEDSYDKGIAYKTILIWEFHNLKPEIKENFIYNLSLTVKEITDFFDYDNVKKPLISDYDFDDELIKIDFDDELNPSDDDVIDHYEWCLWYDYDNINEIFTLKDEDWEIEEEISLEDAKSSTQQSRYESFEFNLDERFDISNKELFEEDYSYYWDSVEIKIGKLNWYTWNEDFDEYIENCLNSTIYNNSNAFKLLDCNIQKDLFNYLLEELFWTRKFDSNFHKITEDELKLHFNEFFVNLDLEEKKDFICSLKWVDNIEISNNTPNEKLLSSIKYNELIRELKELIIDFGELVEYEFVVEESDYYDIKTVSNKKDKFEFYLSNLKETPENFDFKANLDEVKLNLEKFSRSKYHYKIFWDFIPAFVNSFFDKEKIYDPLLKWNFFIFENNKVCPLINELSIEKTIQIYKALVTDSNKEKFINLIINNTKPEFSINLFDEIKNNITSDLSINYRLLLKNIIPTVINDTDRNPLIELANINKKQNIWDLNMVYKLLCIDSDSTEKKYLIFRDYVKECLNNRLDNWINNTLFKEKSSSLEKVLYQEENKDLLYKLYKLWNKNNVIIRELLIKKPNKTKEDVDFFIDNYKWQESLFHLICTEIYTFAWEDKEIIKYTLDKISFVDTVKNSKWVISFTNQLNSIAYLLDKEIIITLLQSKNVYTEDKKSLFRTLLRKNYVHNDNIHTYDFKVFWEENIFKFFDCFEINYILNLENSLYNDIFPPKQWEQFSDKFIVNTLKKYLKINFWYEGELNIHGQITPSFINSEFIINKIKFESDTMLNFSHVFQYFSYDNIKISIENYMEKWNGYFIKILLEYIVNHDYTKFENEDKENSYIILREIFNNQNLFNTIKENGCVTQEFIDIINKDYALIWVKINKENPYPLLKMLDASINDSHFLPKLSNLNNKEIIDWLYKMGQRELKCNYFQNLNSSDSLFLLNHQICNKKNLHQLHKIINNLNTKDLNIYVKSIINTELFIDLINGYWNDLNISLIDHELIYSIPKIYKEKKFILNKGFLDILSKNWFSKNTIFEFIDLTDLFDDQKKLVKKILTNNEGKISDILRIINDDALEELESTSPVKINALIENSNDYNKITSIKTINDLNKEKFENAWISIEKFNSFDKQIQFNSSDNVNIKNIYNNLENSLVNQYKQLFGENWEKWLIHWIDKTIINWVSKGVLDMYNITLKELGKNIKSIHKWVWIDIDHDWLYLKDNSSFKTLWKNASLLINSIWESSKIIDKAFLFKDEFIDTLNNTEKHIFNKVKKNVAKNISDLYKNKKIEKSKIDELNNSLSNINTGELINEVDNIIKIISQKAKPIIQTYINTFENKKLKWTLRNIDYGKLDNTALRSITKYMNIITVEEKKNLWILIKEYKKIASLNNLKSNCTEENINNFKVIFEKLREDKDLNYSETVSHFIKITANVTNNNNKKIWDFIYKVEMLYNDNPENKEIISLNKYIREVKEILNHYNNVKTSIVNHIKDDFWNIDVKKIKNNLLEKREYTMNLWNRHNIIENLNQWYYTHCCISPTWCNWWSMPLYIISENFNIIEIRSKERIIWQAFCYVWKSNKLCNLVIDNVEINNSYSMDSGLIKEKLIEYTNDYRDYIWNLDKIIKIGNNYNDISVNWEHCNELSKIIWYNNLYLDSNQNQREFK